MHGIKRGLGAGDMHVLQFPLLYPTDSLVICCCQKLAGSLPSTGKCHVNQSHCTKLMQDLMSFAISSWGSSLRVRPEWLPLKDSDCFAKRQVNTPQLVSFLSFGHWGINYSQLSSWTRVLSSSESHWSSFLMSFFERIKNCSGSCCSATTYSWIINLKAHIKNICKDLQAMVLSRKVYWWNH